MNDRDLLALEGETVFDLTADGRLLRWSTPGHRPPPRFGIAGCPSGTVFGIGHSVGAETARELARLAEREPPFPEPWTRPVYFDEYRRLLAVEAPITQIGEGIFWVFPERLAFEHPASLVASGTPSGDRLVAHLAEQGMTPLLVEAGFKTIEELWAPWCLALEGEEIAGLAYTVGLRAASAEVGVYTLKSYRGRGLAAAATAGWARHPALRGNTLFYATDRQNISSQRVAERLGLRLLGTSVAMT
jgi:hypothetical protein